MGIDRFCFQRELTFFVRRFVLLCSMPLILAILLLSLSLHPAVRPRLDPFTRIKVQGIGLLSLDGKPALISMGGKAIGGIAIGGVALGVIACGGSAIGLIAFGGGAVGVVAFGGGAVGLVAVGGGAVGAVAIGGGAAGWIAVGGKAAGRYACSVEPARAHWAFTPVRQDREALELFCHWIPKLTGCLNSEMYVTSGQDPSVIWRQGLVIKPDESISDEEVMT